MVLQPSISYANRNISTTSSKLVIFFLYRERKVIHSHTMGLEPTTSPNTCMGEEGLVELELIGQN